MLQVCNPRVGGQCPELLPTQQPLNNNVRKFGSACSAGCTHQALLGNEGMMWVAPSSLPCRRRPCQQK